MSATLHRGVVGTQFQAFGGYFRVIRRQVGRLRQPMIAGKQRLETQWLALERSGSFQGGARPLEGEVPIEGITTCTAVGALRRPGARDVPG